MAKVETVEVPDGKGGKIVVNKDDAHKYANKAAPKPKPKAKRKSKIEYK